ncbi:MAG TPA: efflux RND transporter periplasmic adaptor subunit [Acetobacteraceae bacterium]|nr:efflux RND transporter periplasmic adaptor subunit [Acetobacteraceae bacterium]
MDLRLVMAASVLAPLLLAACKKENAYMPPPPAAVGVMHPIARTVAPYINATGMAVAYNQVTVMARVQGFVQQIAYKDGDRVKAGQLLFLIEPAPYEAQLQQAQAQLAADQAQYDFAAIEYQRQATLAVNSFAAAQTAADQAKATRDSAKAKVENDRAAVAIASINLGYTRVTAPFDGVATNHLVSLGQLVGVGSPTALANVVQLDPIYVTFSANDQEVQQFQTALRKKGIPWPDPSAVSLAIGLTSQTGYPYQGQMDYVSPTADSATGTVLARAVVQNPNNEILPGYYTNVRASAPVLAAPALLVPEVSLGADQEGRYVLVVNKDNVVEKRHLTLGQPEGALRVITAGLQPDDNVVVTGLERAIPGNKVAPQPAPPPAS